MGHIGMARLVGVVVVFRLLWCGVFLWWCGMLRWCGVLWRCGVLWWWCAVLLWHAVIRLGSARGRSVRLMTSASGLASFGVAASARMLRQHGECEERRNGKARDR
jgi:hypothetical protein